MKTPATQAADPVSAAAPLAPPVSAFAVLRRDLGDLREGQVVTGRIGAVQALIDDGAAEPATDGQVAAAAPFHFPLPEA